MPAISCPMTAGWPMPQHDLAQQSPDQHQHDELDEEDGLGRAVAGLRPPGRPVASHQTVQGAKPASGTTSSAAWAQAQSWDRLGRWKPLEPSPASQASDNLTDTGCSGHRMQLQIIRN